MFGGKSGKNGQSWRFLLLLSAFAALGAALFTGFTRSSIVVLLFIVAGWIVSLCLHELAHALVAWFGGDRSVATKGYLSLDPWIYANPTMTFAFPILFLLIGGIGLPGAAVYIDHAALRSRLWDSLVSAAGPLANLLFLALLGLPFYLDVPSRLGPDTFWSALAFLAYLQATAVVLNLLPIPGFDGFGIIRPYLPYDMQAQANAIAGAMGYRSARPVLRAAILDRHPQRLDNSDRSGRHRALLYRQGLCAVPSAPMMGRANASGD